MIGQAQSCEVWVCGHADKLCIINVHRLAEAVLFRKLMDKHRLPTKPLQTPVSLKARSVLKPSAADFRIRARKAVVMVYKSLFFSLKESASVTAEAMYLQQYQMLHKCKK